MRLEDLLRHSAARSAAATAAFEPSGAHVSYRDLNSFSEDIAGQLVSLGVRAGDRVGLCMPKKIAALSSIFGVMKAGGAYVPVDYSAPASRNGFIFSDCAARAVIIEQSLADNVIAHLSHFRASWRAEPLAGPPEFSDGFVVLAPEAIPASIAGPMDGDALSYILYTSGSTGKPKGVMHSHRTALSFIDWCSDEFSPTADDVFSSHAPFHFDLSILDLYTPIKHGASVVLIDSVAGKQPEAISAAIESLGISVWYSTPSILRMLVDAGCVSADRLPRLRIAIAAGEVYPPRQLVKLTQALPHRAIYNLYGPTETNVCTYYRAPHDYDAESGPLPIGFPCSGDRALLIDERGDPVPEGAEGELLIAGGSVMLGYWNLPERNAAAFLKRSDGDWYRTGDIVRRRDDGALLFVGRRDRMVKRRGYRIELGEIEAALNRHGSVVEAAAVAQPTDNDDTLIRAFVAWSGVEKPSIILMKKHCTQNLPLYMTPDQFVFLDELPKTSTDKIDYQKLKELR